MIRIGRGIWRGRILRPDLKRIRPTPARVREAAISIIAERIQGAVVWDLFSGSGAFGIECLSCGAAHAVFADSSQPSLAGIRKFLLETVDCDSFTIVRGRLPESIGRISVKADIVFADPPYDAHAVYSWIGQFAWSTVMNSGGMVIAESGGETFSERWHTRRYGDTCLHIMEV